MKKLVLAAAAIVWGSSAFATGGFSCDIKDDGISFSIEGVTSHGFGAAIVSATGRLATQVGDDGHVREINFDYSREDIKQYWNHLKDFKLVVYKETENQTEYQWTQAVIETTDPNDSGEFTGSLKLKGGGDGMSEWNYEFPITCYVE